MTAEEWASLQGNPGWDALRQYIRDYRGRIMDEWANHVFDADSPYGIRAQIRCEVLHDVAEMDWASIERFYAKPEEPKEQEEE